MIAEEFVGEANGVTTAIIELLESLKNDSFIKLQMTLNHLTLYMPIP